jgi:hypothetical protein
VTRIKKGDNVELELADIIGETDWAVHCRVKWDGGTEGRMVRQVPDQGDCCS